MCHIIHRNRAMSFYHYLKREPELAELVEIITRKASECNIKNSTVRQLILPLLKKVVSNCDLREIVEICSLGDGFDPVPMEYREAHVVTHGTNAWSAIYLSTSDSGLVLLQKVAVASLMSFACEVVQTITPEDTKIHGLMPLEIIGCERIDELSRLGDELTKQMGW